MLVNMTSYIILYQFNTCIVINRNFNIEILQADSSLPGIGIDHQDRQTSLHRLLTQCHHLRFRMITTSQQQGTQFNAIHCSQTGRDDDIRTVTRSHQQTAWFEMMYHVVDRTGTESHNIQTTGIDFAFIDDSCIQMTGQIDSTWRNQLRIPWDATQNLQRRLAKELQNFKLITAAFTGVMCFEHLGQVRAGNTMFINRSANLVDNAANNAFAVSTTKISTGQFDAFFQLLTGIVARMSYQNNICIQCSCDFLIQLISERLLIYRNQAFNHHHFGTTLLNMSLVKSNNFF